MDNPAWVVLDVKANRDYTLLLTFADGSKRMYDARPLLHKTLYEKLKNPKFFLSARAKYDTVVWDEDIDIAPEHLYECSQPIDVLPLHA
jgi:hypothetical protein